MQPDIAEKNTAVKGKVGIISEGEMSFRTSPTTLLQIFCNMIFNSKVIIDSIIDPDDNVLIDINEWLLLSTCAVYTHRHVCVSDDELCHHVTAARHTRHVQTQHRKRDQKQHHLSHYKHWLLQLAMIPLDHYI